LSQNSLKVFFLRWASLFAVEEIMNILLSAGKSWHCCQGGTSCVEPMIDQWLKSSSLAGKATTKTFVVQLALEGGARAIDTLAKIFERRAGKPAWLSK
jgi:hypothetical protein